MFARVFLKPGEEIEVAQGFPWVFDNEIDHVKFDSKSGVKQTGLEECMVKDGEVVEVFANAGGFLGTGVIKKTDIIIL